MKPKAIKLFTYFYPSDLDGGVHYGIFHKKDFEGKSNIEILLHFGLVCHYNGPGNYFEDIGHIQRRKKYIIISQRFGYDI